MNAPDEIRHEQLSQNKPNVEAEDLTEDQIAVHQCEVVQALMAVLPSHCLLYRDEDTAAYRRLPLAVVLLETEAQVQRVVQICARLNVPILPRGAGTGLSGSAMPIRNGIVLSLARFPKIIKSIRMRAPLPCSPACAISPSQRPPRLTGSITRPIRRRRLHAPSAAMSAREFGRHALSCIVSSTAPHVS